MPTLINKNHRISYQLLLPLCFILWGCGVVKEVITASPNEETANIRPLCTNGSVNDLLALSDRIIIGGNFSRIGACTGSSFPVSTVTGQIPSGFKYKTSAIAGRINKVIGDGNGGWYLGGEFTHVGGVERKYIAHLNSNYTLDENFAPDLDAEVTSLFLSGNTLYIGGNFTYVGTVIRKSIVAVNASTGALITTFNPGYTSVAYGRLNTILLVGSSLFVGGQITGVGGSFGGYGFALSDDTSTTTILSNFPVVNGQINKVISDGVGGFYIAGSFNKVGRETRYGLARILSDGSVSSWNPKVDGTVYDMYLNGTKLYIGGQFSIVSGVARSNIAAINTTDGLPTTWDPSASGGSTVFALFVYGSTVYVGGDFTSVGGQSRNRIAALDMATGLATSWNPNANNPVRALFVNGTTLYVGGNFTSIGGQTRNRIAALDTTSGLASTWNPSATSGQVNGVVYNGGKVYVGGTFNVIGGATRRKLVMLDPATANGSGSSSPDYAVSGTGIVNAITFSGATMYVAGNFTAIGGQTINSMAAVNPLTGLAFSTFQSTPSSSLKSVAVSGTSVYFGQISSVSGDDCLNCQLQNSLVAFNATTGAVLPWNSSVPDGDWIEALAVSPDNNTLYVGGNLSAIGGQTRNKLAAVNVSDGLATAWDPGLDDTIHSVGTIAVFGSVVYVGGGFAGNIGGQSRSFAAAIDSATALATSWNPNPNGLVSNLSIFNSTIYITGNFDTIGGQNRTSIAAVDVSGIVSSWNPDLTPLKDANYADVRSIDVQNENVFIAGALTSTQAQTRNGLAALDLNVETLLDWNPNPTAGSVTKKLISTGDIVYVAGSFNILGGQSRSYLGAVSLATGIAAAWQPNPDGIPSEMILDSNLLYVAGSFANIGGAAVSGLAAIDTNTGISSSWPASSDGNINKMLKSAAGIYAAGSFNIATGVARNGAAKFDATSGVTLAWDPAVGGSSTVTDIVGSGSTAYLAGVFLNVGGVNRSGLAAVDATTGAINSTWNPNIGGNSKSGGNQYVSGLTLNDTTLYTWGCFDSVGGLERNSLAAINIADATATSWTPKIQVPGSCISELVKKVVPAGARVYLSGDMTSINGKPVGGVGVVNATTGASVSSEN